jgi:sugar lactone lactonase YvrE
VSGDNGQGSGLNQLAAPFGLYVDDNQTVYMADYLNHRIVQWKNGATSSRVVAGGNERGNRNDQLNCPSDVIVDKESDSLIICDRSNKRVVRWPRRDGTSGEIIISNVDCYGLTMDNDGYLYVSDHSKHEVRRWKIGETNETVVAGGNGEGNRLDQLNDPTDIFVDQDHSVYVSDANNHRVMKWIEGAKEGVLVAGGQGQGNGLKQLSNPHGVVVDQLGSVYVADYSNHRVMRWSKGATQGNVVVGGDGKGGQPNQFNGPTGLSFDRQGNLYVAEHYNHRVQNLKLNRQQINDVDLLCVIENDVH